MTLAPGTSLPSHALADASAFHVVGGSAQFKVADQTIEAFVGASIKVEPYQARSIHVTSKVLLRALRFRWAPFGDRRVWIEPGFLLEPLPPQPTGTGIPEVFDFHRFETKALSFDEK